MSLVEPPPEACPGTGTEESGKVTNSLKILTGNYSHWDLYSNNYSQSDSTPAGCCLWRLSKPIHLRLSWPCCSGPWCWPHRKEPRRSQKHCPRPLWKSNTSRIFSISGRFDCREGLVRVQWQQLWRDVLPQKRIWQWGCLILTSVVPVCQGDFSFWSKKSESILKDDGLWRGRCPPVRFRLVSSICWRQPQCYVRWLPPFFTWSGFLIYPLASLELLFSPQMLQWYGGDRKRTVVWHLVPHHASFC